MSFQPDPNAIEIKGREKKSETAPKGRSYKNKKKEKLVSS